METLMKTTLFFFNNLSSSASSSSSSSSSSFNFYLPKKKGQKYIATFAKKRDNLTHENSTTQQSFFPLKVSKSILAQSAIAIFGLGFIDAGYSGDWSRIGVISKESEDLLKVAAFVVIPLCIFLIFSISRED